MTAAPKLKTYEDLLGIPEDVHGEIHAGELVISAAPLPGHGRTQRSLGHFIGGPFDDDFDGPDGWWIFSEVDVRFTLHDVVRPDLAGWRRSRLPHPDSTRPFELAPDWICEILSPSNEHHDRVFKQQLYARHGVPFYWIVDPEEGLVEAYVLQSGSWIVAGTYGRTTVARIPPFEAIELPVGRLFFPPKPTP
jgi:Uma2 family endonuclease